MASESAFTPEARGNNPGALAKTGDGLAPNIETASGSSFNPGGGVQAIAVIRDAASDVSSMEA